MVLPSTNIEEKAWPRAMVSAGKRMDGLRGLYQRQAVNLPGITKYKSGNIKRV
jgi:hypothetical protein